MTSKRNAWVLALALAVLLPVAVLAQDETTTRMARVPGSPGTDHGGSIQPPPVAPEPVSPPSGSKGSNPQPVLTVLHPNAVLYEFLVYLEEGGVPVTGVVTGEPSWLISGPARGLPPGTYSWTCRIFDGTAWSPFFSPRWTFTIYKSEHPAVTPPAPIPCNPPPGTKGPRLLPELAVIAPIGTAILQFKVMHGDGSGIAATGITSESRWRVATVVSELGVGVYNWTCRTFDGQEWSNWFEPFWTFEVEKPVLPNDGAAGERKVRQADDSRFTPNPSDGSTRLRFTVPRAGNINVTIYSCAGQLVRTLADSRMDAGPCELVWDGRDDCGNRVGAGTYLCRICTDDFTSTVKVTRTR